MEKWIETRKGGNFIKIGERYGIDPVIARVMRNREVCTDEEIRSYLYGGRSDLSDPHLLKDGDKAAELLAQAIAGQQKIRVIGDYDVDGVNATYILLKGLKQVGASVDAAIPDRMKDGYGINESLIRQAHEDGTDLIVTCDNGIAALDAIAYAKELGMQVIVTDHHDIPYRELPNGEREYLRSQADAIINPKQKECTYPYKCLCGAAVAWKLVQLIYERMDVPVEKADIFLENVGFATVGDVMDLTGENRILVKLALERQSHTQNPGMKALIAQNNLLDKRISAYHIGFILGPCINASGRLDTAVRSLELLLEENPAKAASLAADLVQKNETRKDMTMKQTELALQMIEEQHMQQDKVLVVFLPECHESLAGIIAGRIREAYHRPAIVLTRGEDGVKGSGRSIEEYSMFEELTGVSELLTRFGGHPMAAGMSLAEENVPLFRQRLNERTTLTDEDLVEKVHIDVPMPMSYVTEELVYGLELLEPCGKGNVKPVFADRELSIVSARRMGKNQNVLKMKLLTTDGCRVSAVYYDDIDEFWQTLEEKFSQEDVEAAKQGRPNRIRFSAIYEPRINDYYQTNELEMVIRRIR